MGKYRRYISEPKRFGREWWLDIGKNFFWVAIITVLVWVYADLEFTTSVQLRTTVRLTTGNSQSLALVSRPSADITFTVSGNQGNLDSFRRRLAEAGNQLTYDLSQKHGPGELSIAAHELIQKAADQADISMAGISINSTDPAAVYVQLDTLETREATVEFVHTGASLARPPEIEPKTVLVYLPSSQAVSLPDKPIIKTVSTDLANYTQGVHPLMVDLSSQIGQVTVRPDRPSVKVTLEIRQRLQRKTVSVPVNILTPATWAQDGVWDEYELVRQDQLEWRKDIEVEGPQQDIAKLGPEDVQAYVVLTEDDKKEVASWLTRAVLVRFGGDSSVRVVDGQNLTVSFKLVRETGN